MKNINKKSINYGLRILAVLAFVLIFVPFNKVSAYYDNSFFNGCGESGCNYVYAPYPVVYPKPQPVYIAPQPTIVYVEPEAPKTIVYVHHHVTRVVKSAPKLCDVDATTVATNGDDSASGITSAAILGTNGFLPSGLIQWLIFAIIILVIVIMARKAFGAQKKYEETPLKHD